MFYSVCVVEINKQYQYVRVYTELWLWLCVCFIMLFHNLI